MSPLGIRARPDDSHEEGQIMKFTTLGAAILITLTMVTSRPETGSVSGKIAYEGAPAKQRTIDMSMEPGCAKQYKTPVSARGTSSTVSKASK
jgi:hypothetical protein